jgi:hypothetical protein
MGSLIKELESESDNVKIYSDLDNNKNQGHLRNVFIPKFSKKDFCLFSPAHQRPKQK